MPAQGLCLRVTHTGQARISLPLNDINDGVGRDTGDDRFRRSGPAYAPYDEVTGPGSIELVYTSDVAKSFESGTIRSYINSGDVTAEFILGIAIASIIPDILDEGILLTNTPTSIDFVGAGVTATAVGDAVTVNIPGGGGSANHAVLSNLGWTVSGHTGTINTLAAFDGAGAAVHISTTVTGDVTGTLPGPLSVSDFSFAGQAQGDILYFDGTNWQILSAGTAGQVLQTGGPGANPSWTSSPSNLDHSALTNLAWPSSGHTGAAGSLATFDGAGAAGVLTGVAHGDIIYFNGTTWVRLAPGTAGQRLQTNGAGAAPTWVAAGGGTTDHSALTNLGWTASGHTGTANTFAAFNGAGATTNLTTTASGDTSGTWPNLAVNDLSITGEVQGSVLYYNGANWVQLAPGTSGQFLQTQGAGANPTWATATGTTDHTALTNLDWTSSGHTDTAGSLATFDGTTAAALLTGVSHGDIIYFNGTIWTRLAPGTSGQVLQTQGAGSPPQWAAAGSGGDHATLTNLAWTSSGHTGTAGSLATFNGAGAAAEVTGVAHGDILYFNGTTWVRLAPGTVDGNVLTTQTAGSPPTWDNAIAVDTISESTANNGVVVNGTRHYPDSAADPGVGPAPADGDRYYNTTLDMDMRYDGTRAKWLSVASDVFEFGRNGNTAAGSYYQGPGNKTMSSTNGFPAFHNGTIVAFGYTRDDTDATSFEVTEGGTTRSTIASAATSGTQVNLNNDFSAGGILAVRNISGGNTTSDVIGWVRVRWRA